jgi:hypothetical protein
VVTAVTLSIRTAAELAAPEDEAVVEQAAGLQVGEKAGDSGAKLSTCRVPRGMRASSGSPRS